MKHDPVRRSNGTTLGRDRAGHADKAPKPYNPSQSMVASQSRRAARPSTIFRDRLHSIHLRSQSLSSQSCFLSVGTGELASLASAALASAATPLAAGASMMCRL